MIISRTPFRISFVGGGTDLRSFCQRESGKVLSTSIDKFIYIAAKRQLDIVEFKYRISWSKIEFKHSIEDIEHPIVREALKLLDIQFPVEITTFADIPANTGLGSSSAFAVGLLLALFALKGEMATKAKLASLAARIEIDILKRNMGSQDHYASSYGDLNVFTFNKDLSVDVEPVLYDAVYKQKLESNLMLFYTRLKRDASEVLRKQSEEGESVREQLRKMRDLVEPLRDVIISRRNPDLIGEILHEGWLLKRTLNDQISSPNIDDYYERARRAGAIGGKLLGAGGGGFLLIYARREDRVKVKEVLHDLYHLPFKFDKAGTRITYYDQNLGE